MATKEHLKSQTWIAPRTGETDLKFDGVLLATVTVRERHIPEARQTAAIYRTQGGSYVAQYQKYDSSGDAVSQRAAKCTTASEILAFYTIPRITHPPTKLGVRIKRRGADPEEEAPQPGHLLDFGKQVLEEAGKRQPELKDAHVEFVE